MVNSNQPCWLRCVKDIDLNNLDFQEVWNNQEGQNHNSLLKNMYNYVKNIYKSNWTSHITRGFIGKLVNIRGSL